MACWLSSNLVEKLNRKTHYILKAWSFLYPYYTLWVELKDWQYYYLPPLNRARSFSKMAPSNDMSQMARVTFNTDVHIFKRWSFAELITSLHSISITFIRMQTLPFKEMHLNCLSAEWLKFVWPSRCLTCPGLIIIIPNRPMCRTSCWYLPMMSRVILIGITREIILWFPYVITILSFVCPTPMRIHTQLS